MDELLTVDEVATYLRVSRSTVWRWCQAKKVPAFKIGREWRISWPVLEELVASQQKAIAAGLAETGPPAASAGDTPRDERREHPDEGALGGGEQG